MLINVKTPTSVGILTFMSMVNFMLKSVEHEKSLKLRDQGPELQCGLKVKEDLSQVWTFQHAIINAK